MKNIPSIFLTIIVVVADFYFVKWAFNKGYEGPDKLTFFVVGGLLLAFSLLILSSLALNVIAERKGELRIKFEDKPYEQGETVSGIVSLRSNVVLDVNYLRLSFSATTLRRDNGAAHSDVIWKSEIDLLPKGKFSARSQDFEFSFIIPQRADISHENMLSKLVKLSIVGTTHWELQATLDVPGVNLVERAFVRVNDGDLF